MDLYIQVAVVFLGASLFVLVAHVFANTVDTGDGIKRMLLVDNSSYSRDSAVTNFSFSIDARAFPQWAMSTKDQRDVYLVYPSWAPPPANMGQYLSMVTTSINPQILSDRSILVNPYMNGSAGFVPNAIKISNSNNTVLAYLHSYTEQAQQIFDPTNTRGAHAVIRVETFTNPQDGRVIYVCFNQ